MARSSKRVGTIASLKVGAEVGDGSGMAIGRETARVGGLLDAEYVVYRTAAPDDPARVRVSMPENDMSRSLEGTSGKPSGVASMLLQFLSDHIGG
jgi:hypothetical protein